MTAKEYLNRIRMLDFQIRKKKEQLDNLKALRGTVRGFDYSGVKVQTSPHGDETINKAVEIMELENELTNKMLAFEKSRNEIMEEIASLKNEYYIEVLTMRYCDLYSLEQIAVTMRLSFDRTAHIHLEALDSFQKKVLDLKS